MCYTLRIGGVHTETIINQNVFFPILVYVFNAEACREKAVKDVHLFFFYLWEAITFVNNSHRVLKYMYIIFI